MLTIVIKTLIKKPANAFSSLSARRGIEGEAKTTIMKKLLIYLLLIACFESFTSSKPCYCHQQKDAGIPDINVLKKNETLQQNDFDNEIRPLDIFSFRYF